MALWYSGDKILNYQKFNEEIDDYIRNIDVDSIKPQKKDIERAEGIKGISSKASGMSKLIKDPEKLIRRSKAVIIRYGVNSIVWKHFKYALQDMGFSNDQIRKIELEDDIEDNSQFEDDFEDE